jgi:hypothetical protein
MKRKVDLSAAIYMFLIGAILGIAIGIVTDSVVWGIVSALPIIVFLIINDRNLQKKFQKQEAEILKSYSVNGSFLRQAVRDYENIIARG